MDKFLRPERLGVDPSTPDATKHFNHWKRTFENFLRSVDEINPDKLSTLINYVSPNVYDYIAEANDYNEAIQTLDSIYIKPKNEIFARYLLSSRKQEQAESLDQFLQQLKTLAKDCNFKSVSAERARDEAIRDAFIGGLQSCNIRQRLLENNVLDLQTAFMNARSLEMAERQNLSYRPSLTTASASEIKEIETEPQHGTVSALNSKCFFCGYSRHPRAKCPAKEATCKGCGKKGHFQKACLSNQRQSAAIQGTISVLASATPGCLAKSTIKLRLNGIPTEALVDTGSSENFISEDVVLKRKLLRFPSQSKIGMATNNLTSTTLGHVVADLTYQNSKYDKVKLSILPNLCSDIILGHDFLNSHEKLEIQFHGKRSPLSICSVAAARVEEQSLFGNLEEGWKPIATKSRRHNPFNETFIQSEVSKMLQNDIIEPSKSPWRAQVLVTTNERHKKRMVIDYSQTVNKFTYLDAYPQKNISELIETVSKYEIYSTLDLQSAYHQIPIKVEEKHFTAFEANGNLYQFKRIPFGVTNGVACFQRVIDDIIEKEKVSDTFAYVDNVTICGKTQNEHDTNLAKFLAAAKKYGITFNNDKSIISSTVIQLLGYEVKKGEIRPDPERLKSLKEMEPPKDAKSQQRIMGLFAYYSQWISKFSEKSYPISHNNIFPLSGAALTAFRTLKRELEDAVLVTHDPKETLTVETDASDFAIAATLNQKGRPVAFFSRTLTASERGHASIEKEAQAIVEALKKWRHYLLGNHFQLLTDQRSVAFMFHNSHKGKIKNEKIQRWRLELSPFKFDIVYRPGKENAGADTFSRCATTFKNLDDLKLLHQNLCHPGVIRMNHFVQSRNLPYSIDDVKKTIASCPACCELKPRFNSSQQRTLVKATQPFERLSIDFKGPIPSNTHNKYILTMIDEYSRFPFAFPCSNMSTKTVIDCLNQVFVLFGMPAFIHSDRGSSFMSEELKNYLHEKGIATSRTTPYNPRGNGQVERLNGTLWKAISLALRSSNLETTQWESMLPRALHSIRSLLCTATNATPHERLFSFNRRSTTGTTLPAWLTVPGPVLMRKNVRHSKYDPLVEEVELLECNPQYAHVRLADGRESTVAIRHLAPTSVSDSTPLDDATRLNPINNDSPVPPMSEELPQNNTTELSQTGLPNISEEVPQDAPENALSPVSCDNSNFEELLLKQQRVRPYSLRNRVASLRISSV